MDGRKRAKKTGQGEIPGICKYRKRGTTSAKCNTIYIYRSRTEEEREEDIAQKADYQKKMELKDRFFKDYQKTGFSKEFRKKYYGGKNLMKNKIKHFLYQTGIGNKIK